MSKTKAFMAITSILTVISFNFNILLNLLLRFIFENICDESTPIFGISEKSKPININYAMVDSKIYTNKMRLLLNWKWDFDINGFTMTDISLLNPNAKKVALQYTKKNDNIKYIININVENSSIIQKNKITPIQFGEISFTGL